MATRLIYCVILVLLWSAAALAEETPQPGPTDVSCHVLINYKWSDAVSLDDRGRSLDTLFNTIGQLMNEAFEMGGFETNPTGFPVAVTSFHDNHAIFSMRPRCVTSVSFAEQMIDEYKSRLSDGEREHMPTIEVIRESLTIEQAVCGLDATEADCPFAARVFLPIDD